jgi:hypothetical protein
MKTRVMVITENGTVRYKPMADLNGRDAEAKALSLAWQEFPLSMVTYKSVKAFAEKKVRFAIAFVREGLDVREEP